MKSSLVILYHREPYDEVVENGKTIYREKKSPNGIVPTLKTFFANAESSTWIAWKQVTSKQQVNFEERVTMEGWSDKAVIRRIPLSAEQVREVLLHHRQGSLLAHSALLPRALHLRKLRLGELPTHQSAVCRSRLRRSRR
jgi:hypothetical protein